jgi:uncharacterized protein YndB with AHSA1/START domain
MIPLKKLNSIMDPFIASNPDCEIVSTRTMDFPRELVYAAWTEPEHFKNWWGPAGFTNTFHVFDLRPGGRWKFTMHGPDKGNYENEAEFVKLEPPALIAWKRHSQPLFRVLATFAEVEPGRTLVVFRQIFDTERECGKVKKFAVEKNEENFDRLEAELARMHEASIGNRKL